MRILGPNSFHGDSSAACRAMDSLWQHERRNRQIASSTGRDYPSLLGKARLEGARPDYIAISCDPKEQTGADLWS
jgi:hypothetical protein